MAHFVNFAPYRTVGGRPRNASGERRPACGQRPGQRRQEGGPPGVAHPGDKTDPGVLWYQPVICGQKPLRGAAVSTYDHYATPVEPGTWDVPAAGATRLSWEYDEGRQRLLDLYQRGKDKQWDAVKRIDWDLPVDPTNIMETSDEFVPIYGSRQWEILNQAERDELGHHLGAWLFSQFLHGEQGALTVAARIVESVPDMDSKFYAATQTMDEARHVELYSRFLREKVGLYYPMNSDLGKLLAESLND